MMIQASRGGGYVRRHMIPVTRDTGPDFSVPNVIILNGHSIAAEVSKTLYPSICKGRDSLIQECHHSICKVDERKHVLHQVR